MATFWNHTLPIFPVRGGVAIVNPIVQRFGTVGFVAKNGAGPERWIVSCYHVFCRINEIMPAGVLEPLFYPLDLSHQMPVAMASDQRADKNLDCAAALVTNNIALGQILGIGRLSPAIAPTVGMRVIKSGAETGVTEGTVMSVSPSQVEIAPFGMPSRYELSEGGDSGAVWVDANSNAPVALHFQGSDWGTPERAFARLILTVLEALRLELSID